MNARALEGLQVLECCELVAGPFCAKLLGDFGAHATKIEEPPEGDAARRLGPFAGDHPSPENSALFVYLNTNKRGITLNLGSPTGREVFTKLLQGADVLVMDKQPSQLRALGLDYQELQRLHPRLIITSITPFGLTGPYADYRAYPLNVYHAGSDGYLLPAGLAYELFPDREPIKGGGYLGEYKAGLTAAMATLGALYLQQSQGVGQLIDISKQEAILSLNRHLIGSLVLENRVYARYNNAFAYGGCVPCKNGYVEFLTLQEHEWNALLALMGNPGWAQDPEWKDVHYRYEHGGEINQHIRAWAKEHTKEEIYREGQAKGVPVGIFHSPDEVVHSEHERARGFFAEVELPCLGKVPFPTSPFKLSETPWSFRCSPPKLGEHTAQVLGTLGYDSESLTLLRRAGII